MYAYQMSNRYFAQIADKMEDMGASELESLGATDVKPVFRGIYFTADTYTLYRINYTTRLSTRILAPLMTFDCHSTKYLYKTARLIEWTNIFTLDQTFCISANTISSKITHSQYAALCLKDAIVDSFRERTGDRPNIDRIEADIRFHLHIENNKATIYLDTSGGSLHRRGYRTEGVKAPLTETLAAAIIRLTEWDGATPLYDPMCGSGTLLCEAMLNYCRVPSAFNRHAFGFMFLPDYDASIWKTVQKDASASERELPEGIISGSDIDHDTVEAARRNIGSIRGSRNLRCSQVRFQDIKNLENCTIVTNPPYGKRIGNREDPGELIKTFGDFLKQKCTGSTAYIYFGNRELIKSVGLRPAWKKPLKNGPLDGRLVKYELY